VGIAGLSVDVPKKSRRDHALANGHGSADAGLRHLWTNEAPNDIRQALQRQNPNDEDRGLSKVSESDLPGFGKNAAKTRELKRAFLGRPANVRLERVPGSEACDIMLPCMVERLRRQA
jgi:hypothetical protein